MTGGAAEVEPELDYIRDLVESCMLPALTEDLDQLQLQPQHFESYQARLRQELPKLYDLLQRNENIWLNDPDAALQQLRAQLVLLFCELTASPTVYKLDNGDEFLLRNANKLIEKLSRACNKEVEEAHIFSYYKQKLHINCWKRQLGATHGYVRYLEQRYVTDVKMPVQMLTFGLSVGLNVRECYESVYKQLGVRIFSLMLTHSNFDDLQNLNIHAVIYEHVFKDTYNMDTDTIEATEAIWNCLVMCLDHFTELNSFAWNHCDDMLERLIQSVTMASNAQTSICLLQLITRLGYHFTLNRCEIEAKLDGEEIAACREACAALSACVSYRWAKAILQMLVLESEKLLQSVEVCEQMLLHMQRCYLVCILPIPLQALHVHLNEFYVKFVAVLLNCIVVHENAPAIINLVRQFIDTFRFQLQNILADNDLPGDLGEFPHAFDVLQQTIVK